MHANLFVFILKTIPGMRKCVSKVGSVRYPSNAARVLGAEHIFYEEHDARPVWFALIKHLICIRNADPCLVDVAS